MFPEKDTRRFDRRGRFNVDTGKTVKYCHICSHDEHKYPIKERYLVYKRKSLYHHSPDQKEQSCHYGTHGQCARCHIYSNHPLNKSSQKTKGHHKHDN